MSESTAGNVKYLVSRNWTATYFTYYKQWIMIYNLACLVQ